MPCHLPYIPQRLHCNGRPDINQFYLHEYLFRRCLEKDKENPFLTISLVDVSVNRSGPPDNILSVPGDVLFNTSPGKYGDTERLNMAVTPLQITELTENNNYIKRQTIVKELKNQPNEHTCSINLRHKKEECMYPHCAFEIYYDDIELTFENHDDLIGRNKHLRTWCKNELAKMIIKEEVRITWSFDEPES